MAIYSLSINPASRGNGKSAIAMAAYRAGERLLDHLTGKVVDYTKKAGVILKEILCPHDIKIEREELWNLAEKAEKRKDARIAREIRLALPHDLDEKERENLAREFAHDLVNKYGVAVDLSIHLPDKKGDQRNHHAHLLLTTRQITREGLGEKSTLERSDKFLREHGLKSGKQQMIEIRDAWENFCNRTLERQGIDERISAKSNKGRGIDRDPMIHLGPTATALERNGIKTERGNLNRIIEKENKNHELQKEINLLEKTIQVFIHFRNIYNEFKTVVKSKIERFLQHDKAKEIEINLQEQRKDSERELSDIKFFAKHNKDREGTETARNLSASVLLERQKKELEKTESERALGPSELLKKQPKRDISQSRDKDGVER